MEELVTLISLPFIFCTWGEIWALPAAFRSSFINWSELTISLEIVTCCCVNILAWSFWEHFYTSKMKIGTFVPWTVIVNIHNADFSNAFCSVCHYLFVADFNICILYLFSYNYILSETSKKEDISWYWKLSWTYFDKRLYAFFISDFHSACFTKWLTLYLWCLTLTNIERKEKHYYFFHFVVFLITV